MKRLLVIALSGAALFVGCGYAGEDFPTLDEAIGQCGAEGVVQVVDKSQDGSVDYYNLVICKNGQVIKAG